MAKSVLEMLLDLDGGLKDKIEALKAAHPELADNDKQAKELIELFNGEGVTPAATVTTPASAAAASAVHTPAVPAAASAAPATAAPVTPAAASEASNSLLQAVMGLKASIDEQNKKFTNVVTKDDLPKLQGQMLASTIRNAHETFQMEADHKEMFGEKLDLNKVDTFIEEQGKSGVRFPSIRAAYNAMTATERQNKEVERLVAEQVKQKTSGTSVPGQTTSAALSPAQQVMADAKKGAGAGASHKEQLIAAADKVLRQREQAAVN